MGKDDSDALVFWSLYCPGAVLIGVEFQDQGFVGLSQIGSIQTGSAG